MRQHYPGKGAIDARTKACLLTSVHAHDDVRIFYRECRTLAQGGYDVVLIVPHDRDEVRGDVRITVVPRSRSRLVRVLFTPWCVYRRSLEENADVYHFHDPELIGIALLLKLHRKRVIYDVHEDLPRQILSKYWIPRPLRRVVGTAAAMAEAVSASVFDGVVAATPDIALRFPEAKTVVVRNLPAVSELAPRATEAYRERDPLLAYVGGISAIRGARELMEALARIPKTRSARLLVAGEFDPPQLEDELRQMPGWERVCFLGWQSRQGIRETLARARAGLVVLHPEPSYTRSLPIKLFEYMSASIPVIASDFPLWREIVNGSACGVLVDPLNPVEIARTILWVLDHPEEAEAMGTRGRDAVLRTYNWPVEGEKLIGLYASIAREKMDDGRSP